MRGLVPRWGGGGAWQNPRCQFAVPSHNSGFSYLGVPAAAGMCDWYENRLPQSNSSLVCRDWSQECADCGVGRGACSAGACPPLGRRRGVAESAVPIRCTKPQLRFFIPRCAGRSRYVRLVRKQTPSIQFITCMPRLVSRMCRLWGVGEGNVARGLVPRRGRGGAWQNPPCQFFVPKHNFGFSYLGVPAPAGMSDSYESMSRTPIRDRLRYRLATPISGVRRSPPSTATVTPAIERPAPYPDTGPESREEGQDRHSMGRIPRPHCHPLTRPSQRPR